VDTLILSTVLREGVPCGASIDVLAGVSGVSIEVFYNRQRRHTSIGSIPPVSFEARHTDGLGLAA
jgi:hypothetical protein